MILVGPMQLHQPQPLDPMEPFFTGTQSDGGYWQDASRISAHNHTGGLNGNPVTAVIPPGSITSGQLDPSVLLPYALTDGSKPFTGQVTMQADAVVRDALFFGEQGTALAPDAILTRTGAGLLGLTGAWHAPSGTWDVKTGTAPGTTRASIAQTGTLSLSPAANAWGQIIQGVTTPVGQSYGLWIRAGTGAGDVPLQVAKADNSKTLLNLNGAGTLQITPDGGSHAIVAAGNVIPGTDNSAYCGAAPNRWIAVYAVNGAIQTSSAELKQAITPLDPAAALAAVLNTDPVVFDYTPPERTAEWYELPDDPEQAEAVLHQRLTSSPLEAAARHQAGFVLQDATGQYQTDPLFETGAGQSNAANSVGVLIGALHALAARVTALEGA